MHKWFRIATSGKTIDGREITAQQIEQMAQSYDRNIYGARVWLEHIRGLLPDSSFAALGDVIALRSVDLTDGKKALEAQIEPTEKLREINKSKQKIYSSAEITPQFPTTGGAYLSGLSVTDSPASLGTQALAFSLQNREAFRRSLPEKEAYKAENEYGEYYEMSECHTDTPNQSDGLSKKIDAVMDAIKNFATKPAQKTEKQPDTQQNQQMLTEIHTGLQEIAETVKAFAALEQQILDLQKTTEKQQEMLNKIDNTPAHCPRPVFTGRNVEITDC